MAAVFVTDQSSLTACEVHLLSDQTIIMQVVVNTLLAGEWEAQPLPPDAASRSP